jgi:UDP-N-acetylglucosamine--N-acetylmuramyl-(pentapeptide) pyrophosphoryl-undecaprenol N-acetylglucosamine transferase
MRILIAAGGTGGHIYPALAVASRLASQRADVELRWVGGRRGLEGELVPAAGLPFERLLLRSLRSVELSIDSFLDPLRLLLSVPQALVSLLRWRPDAVYATGGYVAIPVLIAAALLRTPSVLWEGNRIPGRSVRLVARLASLRAVSFAATRRELPEPTYLTGTPIRGLAGLDRTEARARLGIPPGPPVMLVFGGSQSVQRLDQAMAEAAADLVTRCVVVHLTGAGSYAGAIRLRDALPLGRRERYRPFASLGLDMAAALSAADLLVGRAGSSTLAEATAVGLPMVLVPYPHAASHQQANVADAEAAGAAISVADEAFDGDALRAAADLLFDERLGRMAAASRSLARPGAAAVNAALLISLVEGAGLPDPETLDAQSRALA